MTGGFIFNYISFIHNFAKQIFCVIAGFLAAGQVQAQSNFLDIFQPGAVDESSFYDASAGSAKPPSELALTGPFASKLAIVSEPKTSHGLLKWNSARDGDWKLLIATPGWGRKDISTFDHLEFLLNAPLPIPDTNFPKIHLESSLNFTSATVELGKFFDESSAKNSNAWRKIKIPLSAFEPWGNFKLSQFKAVVFSQGLPDNEPRTLLLGRVRVVSTNSPASTNPPFAPRNLVVRTGDRSVALHWDVQEENSIRGYNIYRAFSADKPFNKLSAVSIRSYGDLAVTNAHEYYYRISATNHFGESALSPIIRATPKPFSSDEEFLDLVQQTAFDYFWYEANPNNGLVRDRSRPYSSASIAATGFGLTAIGIGIDREWITRSAGRERVLQTLKTFWEMPQGTSASGTIGHKGWFYHFLEMDTATRAGRSELSSVDTALFLGGVLYAKQYFNRDDPAEKEIRRLGTAIFDRIDWNWMANGADTLSMGWRPETGFIRSRWIGYNEAMILYLLGIGAQKNPLPATQWQNWTNGYKWETHYGYGFVNFPPLFGHQYSHCWIDFRGTADFYMREKGLTYFENSRRATLAQREYAIANPAKGYGSNLWGWTACDGPGTLGKFGYSARGTPPVENEDGTIAPTAAGGSFAFTPEYSLAALRNFYDQFRAKIWTGYGFRDAFNLEVNWWAADVLGIDQGPILLMIENHRTGNVWKMFMKNPEVERGMRRAGFTTYSPPVLNP